MNTPAHESCGYACEEYARVSRRQFLGAAGLATAAAVAAPAWLPRVALAQSPRAATRDVIISVYLRGGSDGLSMCVPYADNNYYLARPNLNIPRPDDPDLNHCTDLDGFFGLPPAMLALLPAYQNGHFLVVHATGSTDPSRSHFDAQRYMEIGKPADPSVFTGWLGRHLYSVAPADPNALLRAVGISSGLPRSLAGAPLSLPIPDLDRFDLQGNTSSIASRTGALRDMYNGYTDPLKATAANTFNTIDLLNTINFATYSPAGGAVYPVNTGNGTINNFSYAMKTTAALVKAEIGVEAVAIDVPGWDTHAQQSPTAGTMYTLMKGLADTLAAFYSDLFAQTAPTFTLVVMSEFGRRVQENTSSGTDHGHGNCMLLLGNAVHGGRVVRQWPGLATNQLFEGLDLAVTIDYRDILAEIVQQRLGNANLAHVFPGYTPTFRGVLH